MIRRSFRIGLWLGVATALGYMAVRTRQRTRPETPEAAPGSGDHAWPPIEAKPVAPSAPVPAPIAPADSAPPDPQPADPPAAADGPAPAEASAPSKKRPAKKPGAKRKPAAPARAWVEPSGKTCPGTHPIKANESSKIFHVPGGLSYDRTAPERCYSDEAAAEADGFRKARR